MHTWSRGTMPVNNVQAERHGPSMTIRWPESRISVNFWTYEETSPPGSPTIRTSADATHVTRADATAPASIACHFMEYPLPSIKERYYRALWQEFGDSAIFVLKCLSELPHVAANGAIRRGKSKPRSVPLRPAKRF